MRSRRFVCFLLGIWMGASALFALQVYQNFDTVAEVLKAPPGQLNDVLKIMTPEKARAFLRYTAGRQHISTFEIWEDIQLVLGFLVTALLLLDKSTRVLAVMTVSMILVVLFVHLKFTPEMAWLSGSIEFVRWTAESPPRDQFWNLHRMYMILDAMKIALGLGLAAILSLQRGKRVRRQSMSEEAAAHAIGGRAASRPV